MQGKGATRSYVTPTSVANVEIYWEGGNKWEQVIGW